MLASLLAVLFVLATIGGESYTVLFLYTACILNLIINKCKFEARFSPTGRTSPVSFIPK